jgi:hypothetical protein
MKFGLQFFCKIGKEDNFPIYRSSDDLLAILQVLSKSLFPLILPNYPLTEI